MSHFTSHRCNWSRSHRTCIFLFVFGLHLRTLASELEYDYMRVWMKGGGGLEISNQ